jgi:hypothetical protein
MLQKLKSQALDSNQCLATYLLFVSWNTSDVKI